MITTGAPLGQDPIVSTSEAARGLADAASDLCLSCGLCCNGGLYGNVALSDDDRSRLAAAGLDAPEELVHPCRHFAAGPCAIYAVRPTACRTYRCRVLKAFDNEEIDLATARSRVSEALALRERMHAATPEGLTVQQMAKEWAAAAPTDRTPDRARAVIAYVAYWRFAERYFLRSGDKRVSRVEI